jgi:hypothetical protein
MRLIRFVLVAALLAVASCVQSAQGGGTAPLQSVQADRKPPPTAGSIGPTVRRADPVIAAAGDIACETLIPGETTCHHGATSDLLVEGGYDRVLALGDNQYQEGAFDDYRTDFHPTWGRVKRRIRPAAGNHEYQTPEARGYFRYFRGAAGPRDKGYYSFDVGTWHIVALNSNCGEVSCAAGSEQEQWLRADLAEHDNTCTLAYWHHPRWSSGTEHGGTDDVAPFIEALYDLGAEVVLVGHEHNYERFAPQNPAGEEDTSRGIREFVAGTGGKSHYPFGTPEPNSQVRSFDTYGLLQLTLHPDSYEWEFVPEEGASFTDSGRTDCH